MIIENGTISLVHSEHKFIRDRIDNDRSYWRCRHSFKFNCKARVVTKLVNGYEMLKIRNADHNHTEIKKIKKRKKTAKLRCKSKLVPRLIRPQLSTQALLKFTTKTMPKLIPKTIPRIENIPRNDDNDNENAFVDILDWLHFQSDTFYFFKKNKNLQNPFRIDDQDKKIENIYDNFNILFFRVKTSPRNLFGGHR